MSRKWWQDNIITDIKYPLSIDIFILILVHSKRYGHGHVYFDCTYLANCEINITISIEYEVLYAL